MALEIERKFLVTSDGWRQASAILRLRQGYLSTDPKRTVRVRLDAERAWLTVKGKSHGAVRLEFEYSIPASDAEELLGLCDTVIEKRRHLVTWAGHTWEVDEFLGDNAGLVIAELEAVNEPTLERALTDPPPWVGRDVTADPRFTNSALSLSPFCRWSEAERADIGRG